VSPEADLEAVRPDLAAWWLANLEKFPGPGDFWRTDLANRAADDLARRGLVPSPLL
jgi:hypothetical protein